jgi:transposase
LEAEGFGASQIAKQLKIGRASVYRVLEDWQFDLTENEADQTPATLAV